MVTGNDLGQTVGSLSRKTLDKVGENRQTPFRSGYQSSLFVP